MSTESRAGLETTQSIEKMNSIACSAAAVQTPARRAPLAASRQRIPSCAARRASLEQRRFCITLAAPDSESKESAPANAAGSGVEVGEDGALYDDGLPDDPSKGMSDDMKVRGQKRKCARSSATCILYLFFSFQIGKALSSLDCRSDSGKSTWNGEAQKTPRSKVRGVKVPLFVFAHLAGFETVGFERVAIAGVEAFALLCAQMLATA